MYRNFVSWNSRSQRHGLPQRHGLVWGASARTALTARVALTLLVAGTSLFALSPVHAQDDLPPAPPATGTAPKPDPELAMTAGELRLDGKITAITGAGTFVIEATSFTSPAGKQKEFEDVKSKRIVVPADAIVRGLEGPRRFKFADLKLKGPVAVIGKSAPDGSLQARIVILLDANNIKTIGTIIVSPVVAQLGRQALEAYKRGQIEHAIQLLKQANDVAVASGDRPGQMLSAGNLSVFLMSGGQAKAALQFANRGLGISQELGGKGDIALMYSHVASAQLMLGQREAAFKSLESGLSAARTADDPKVLLSLLTEMAEAVVGSKRDAEGLTRAANLYNEALPLARNENDDQQVADILVSTAIIRALQGNTAQARELGTQVQTMVGNLTDNAERGAILEQLGVLYAQDGVQDAELSKGFWNKAVDAYTAGGNPNAAERVQRRLKGELKGLDEGDNTTKGDKDGGKDGGELMDG